MGMINKGFDKDEYINSDDGSIFRGAERREERIRKLERAKEIADGTILGTFDRDEDVWGLVDKIKGGDK